MDPLSFMSWVTLLFTFVLECMESYHNLLFLIDLGPMGTVPRCSERFLDSNLKRDPSPRCETHLHPICHLPLKTIFSNYNWAKEGAIYSHSLLHPTTQNVLIYFGYKISFKNTLEGHVRDKIYLLLDILYYMFPKRYKIFQEKISKPIDSKVSNIK